MTKKERAEDERLDRAIAIDLDAEIEKHAARRHRAPIFARAPAAEVDAKLARALPREGAPIEEALGEIDRALMAHARRNAHPGFFGYLVGPGLPTDPIAHAIAAAVNQNATGFSSAPAAASIERAVVAWMAELAGFPDTAAGLLLSGASTANLVALTAAMHRVGGSVLREDGIAASVAREGPLFLYAAETAHFSVERAAVLLGIGKVCLRKVPVDDRMRIDPAKLALMLDGAVAHEKRPIAVVATAGTTTAGVVDPLEAVAGVCEERGVWMHVDGAYGGAALASPTLAKRLAGIERASSFVVDFHKWLYLAESASALVFRDVEAAREVYFTEADYVRLPRETVAEELCYFHLGPETSRPFRALAPYLALRHYGLARIAKSLEADVRCARYLADRVKSERDLELLLEPDLSIVCFRFAPKDRSPEDVDAMNRFLRDELEREGDFYLSATNLAGRPILRVAVLNGAASEATMDALVDRVLDLGHARARG